MNRKKEVKEIYKKMENSDTTEELKCLKELYKTAKDLGIFRRVEILNEIVEEGFDAACQGYLTMCEIEKKPNRKSPLALVTKKKTGFWEDVCTFSNIGLQISTTVSGADHSETKEWGKRKESPVQFFEEFVLASKT